MTKIAIIILLLWTGHIYGKIDKYVRISLDAKWKNTPLALEASEFIAEKSNKQFWEFVKAFQDVNARTDKEFYDAIFKKAFGILSIAELDVLQFALSIRNFSPRVQLHYQLSTEHKSLNCATFFEVSDELVTCDLQKALKEATSLSSTIQSQRFDHIYPGSESNKNTIIVYTDFSTNADFKAVHSHILENIKSSEIKYILRHSYKVSDENSKVRLSGYCVELAIKSTEYKNVDDQKVADTKKKEKLAEVGDDEVEGFLFNRLRELHPALQDDLNKFKDHLKESNKELAPLKVWQLQDLSFQAAQRVMSSSSTDALKVLKDVSQNGPMLARSLVKTHVPQDLRDEITKNQQEFGNNGIQAGESALYINGIEIPVEKLDAFKLLDIFNSEASSMEELNYLDIEGSKIGQLLTLSVKPEQEEFVVDTRSDSVQWMNDLENDDQYNYWPRQLQEILRPTFPGMLRYIAKNIFHAVLYMDPTSEKSINLLLQFDSLIENSLPLRFGVVFIANGDVSDKAEENVGAAIIRAFSFIKSDKDNKAAFKFLVKLYTSAKGKAPKASDVINQFTSMYGKSETEDILGPDSEYDDMRRVSKLIFNSLGLKSLPQVLINGQQMEKHKLAQLESSIVEIVLSQTPSIQQAVYMGQHYGFPSIYDFIMSQPNVVTRLNSIIQTLPEKLAQIDGRVKEDIATASLEGLKKLSSKQAVGVLLNNAKYFVQDSGASTIWVIADAQTKDGITLIKNAMDYVIKQKDGRLALILNGDSIENSVIQTVLGLRQKLISGVAKLLSKLLALDDFTQVIKEPELVNKIANGITGINKKKLVELLTSKETLKTSAEISKKSSVLVQTAFGVSSGDNLVFANGRILGPLKDEEIFVHQDFELLQSFENNRGGFKIFEIVNSMSFKNLPSEGHERYKSDIGLGVFVALSQRGQESRKILSFQDDKHSVVHVKPRKEGISYQVDAVLDPLSNGAQKLIPVLTVLHETFNVDLKIFLNCLSKHSEMPLKRFYQYVLQPRLNFDSNGKLMSDQEAIFKNLPHSALLTLIMDTPQSWMIEAVGSNQDLDNIFLGQANELVYGDFELENVIIEGHASDESSHSPPRGLQFVLGTNKQPEIFDTIVMANLGYFQLKAYPGLFVLKLRDGRSSVVYKIDSLEGGTELHAGENYTVIVDSFAGTFLKAKVLRRPGQEKTDLLGDGDEEDDSLWSSLTNYVKAGSTKVTEDKIHIFSVATGLLYERFLRIMMLSVLKHTKTPVKFWFLKNYLSSGFTKFLPTYAEKYGFEYELVQYQWPKWLNGQTEKQRIIWGYKILFLDVLFPLNLERIIFVDADQIVRADLKELMDMDLRGAPYAYTPFCNDRKEVEGFRFWNQGYWKNHLAGRPYHISALYVVDLKRFRRVAAGDRLRGQYQGLSQDPNSLANLDQDLPNNMIHQVEIFSLPQEWLWCETWCSDESKKKAKTIDMCNNPQTKEPKLDRAIRIAPEWTEYDDIIRKLHEEMSTKQQFNQSKQNEKLEKVEL